MSEWRDIATAPKDRSEVLLCLRRDVPGRCDYGGRCFVALHPGVDPDGFDIGWSLFPGYGGIPDKWVAGWMPLPEPPEPA